MKPHVERAIRLCAIGLLLVSSVGFEAHEAAWAQTQAQRAVDAAAQAQKRGADAIDRANSAQERAAAATERAANAQDRASGAIESASNALERASQSADRTGNATDGARNRATDARGAVPALVQRQYEDLVLANPENLEMLDRLAVVRGEVLALEPSRNSLDAARRNGFVVVSEDEIEGIALRYATLRVPRGKTVKQALAMLRSFAPDSEFAANHIHLQSSQAPIRGELTPVAPSVLIEGAAIGLIDGGVALTKHVPRVMQRGFAAGAPAADPHATALASLLAGSGGIKSAAPGAPVLVADIYGHDPTGGSALALARALGWMAVRRTPVIVIGLVGPPNPIVERAIRRILANGALVVAPVGNAGAAAPPLYPAAYPSVIGVTGVDRQNRALVEAGRGDHVDFAAPGADILGTSMNGRLMKLRGTSFAAPLVAGMLWRYRDSAEPVRQLEQQALDLGRKGRDRVYGLGLVCASCR